MTWKIEQRVTFDITKAHLYDDSEWGEKLRKPRLGTIIGVPLATRDYGKGIVLVDWDSLNGKKTNPSKWLKWHVTDHLRVAA